MLIRIESCAGCPAFWEDTDKLLNNYLGYCLIETEHGRWDDDNWGDIPPWCPLRAYEFYCSKGCKAFGIAIAHGVTDFNVQEGEDVPD